MSLQRIDSTVYADDFEVGQRIAHSLQRTVTASESIMFSALTLHQQSVYVYGPQEALVLNPFLLLNLGIGLTVRDLSESKRGGAFAGLDKVQFLRDVQLQEGLRASSSVLAVRPSNSRPTLGIVTWSTTVSADSGGPVLQYERTNLLPLSRSEVNP